MATAFVVEAKIGVKIKQRTARRQSSTKTIRKVEESFPVSESDIGFYIEKLESLREELNTFDAEIETYMLENVWDDDIYDEQSSLCEQYNDNLSSMIHKLKVALANLQVNCNEYNSAIAAGSSDNLPMLESSGVSTTKLKLPKIELPVFDGKPESYNNFIVSLENILSKFNFTPYERYSYLKQQVSGPARIIVESLPDGSLTYDAAKALLESAFSDVTLQQFSVISRLAALKLGCTDDFYNWVSEARQIDAQISRLNINSDIFMQFFLWNGLSDKFKQAFISVTNKARPSKEEIIEKSFDIYNCMKESNSLVPKNTVTLATSISHDSPKINYKKGCWLCQIVDRKSYADHKILNCPVFKTPESKLKKVKQLNGCTRCGLLNHVVSDCKFSFTGNCRNCNGVHAAFLCVSNSASNEHSGSTSVKPKNDYSKSRKDKKEVKTNLVEFHVMHTNVSSNIAIPTFSTQFRTVVNTLVEKRLMYDPASQSSFVTSSALSNLRHKVIKSKVKVKVTGFNGDKYYDTQIVQLSTTINGKQQNFNAVVVPQMKTKVNHPKIKQIVSAFDAENISLADNLFRDAGDDGTVDLLLGVDAAHILPVQSCRFGPRDSPSLVYYCAKGVMIAGDISTLLLNLPHLHFVSEFIKKFHSVF